MKSDGPSRVDVTPVVRLAALLGIFGMFAVVGIAYAGVAMAATGESADAAEPIEANSAPATDAPPLRSPENPLGLSETQRNRIEELVSESQVRASQLKTELKAARADLTQALDGEEPDFDEVMHEIDRVGDLETRMRKHQIATLLSLRAELSPDQREGLTRVFKRLASDAPPDRPARRRKRGAHPLDVTAPTLAIDGDRAAAETP